MRVVALQKITVLNMLVTALILQVRVVFRSLRSVFDLAETYRTTSCRTVAIVMVKIMLSVEVFILFINPRESRMLQKPP